ncbi:MAG: membrane protein insertase YidC [Cypionkella sp.]|nr:membrane protein insertase YidC [Cypionkella sp.]
MDDQNKNLILATALSLGVILIWFVGGPMVFPQWFPEPSTQTQLTTPDGTPVDAAKVPPAPNAAPNAATETAAESANDAPRITIDTPKLSGTISTLGGRIDDLSLKTYRDTLAVDSATVKLLSPVGDTTPYFAVFGWANGEGLTSDDVPNALTVWQTTSGETLTPETPVTLQWQNAKGLTFTRTIAVDKAAMFTVTDEVKNSSSASVNLYNYGIVARYGLPKLTNIYVVHEGLIRRTDGVYHEENYDDFAGLPISEREGAHLETVEAANEGWIGFTDHYWMTTLIPAQGQAFTAASKFLPTDNKYQAEVRYPLVTLAAGQSTISTTRVFAGAKEWATIRDYQNKDGIAGFIDSIDWGWFYFLTKPIFAVLHWLNLQIGNMGVAIIGLTFVLKLLVLPLAYKSYVSMARMKELQPEMEALKEKFGEDRAGLQKAMMGLYKDKKVNPAAGCLPILIQIPIFFALYKVIFVTIELRHAPFFGWLNDLSAPDTSSLFNLFGLLPWGAPEAGSILALIFIGVLPILLGITMWLQQKLNPAPTDAVQQQIFAWMPWVFMFMLGSFASGLVVYWITNNTITFIQQYLIMRSHGHTPDIFGNIKSGFSKKAATGPIESKKK